MIPVRYVLENEWLVTKPQCSTKSLFDIDDGSERQGWTLDFSCFDLQPGIHHHYDELVVESYFGPDFILCRENYNDWIRNRRWQFFNVDLVESGPGPEGIKYLFAFDYMKENVFPALSHESLIDIPMRVLYLTPPASLLPKNELWGQIPFKEITDDC